MPNYYRADTFEITFISQDVIDAWTASKNPKLGFYIPLPDKPSDNAIWSNGEWVIPAPPEIVITPTMEERIEAAEFIISLLLDATQGANNV